MHGAGRRHQDSGGVCVEGRRGVAGGREHGTAQGGAVRGGDAMLCEEGCAERRRRGCGEDGRRRRGGDGAESGRGGQGGCTGGGSIRGVCGWWGQRCGLRGQRRLDGGGGCGGVQAAAEHGEAAAGRLRPRDGGPAGGGGGGHWEGGERRFGGREGSISGEEWRFFVEVGAGEGGASGGRGGGRFTRTAVMGTATRGVERGWGGGRGRGGGGGGDGV